MSNPQVFLETAKMLDRVLVPAVDAGGVQYPFFGETQNFKFYCQKTLGDKGKAVAHTLKQKCEESFSKLKDLFGVEPPSLHFTVYVADDIPGAMHYGCESTEIYVGMIKSVPSTHEQYSRLLAAEISEVLQAKIGLWRCDYSNGEALSRVLANWLYPKDELDDFLTAPAWLFEKAPDDSHRQDWVNNTEPADTNKFSVGCSVLFLNWLQQKHDWKCIIRKGAYNLAETYEKLKEKGDGWNKFRIEMEHRFPLDKPFELHTDNPFRNPPKPPLVG